MRNISFFLVIFLFFSSISQAHFKALKKRIYVSIQKGEAWDSLKLEKQQKFIGDHVRFVKDLRIKNRARVIASEDGHAQSMMILRISDLKEAKNILSKK